MIDCLPLGFPLLPKIIKISIHQLGAHVCAKEYVLQGEFLQTGSVFPNWQHIVSLQHIDFWWQNVHMVFY